MEVLFLSFAIVIQTISMGRAYAIAPPSEANFKLFKVGVLVTTFITILATCFGYTDGWVSLCIPSISGTCEYLLGTSSLIAIACFLVFYKYPVYLYPWEQHPRDLPQPTTHGYRQIRYIRWIGPETSLSYETTWEGEIINEIWITNKTKQHD